MFDIVFRCIVAALVLTAVAFIVGGTIYRTLYAK